VRSPNRGASLTRIAQDGVSLVGFAKEYDIEWKFRETRLYQVAPVSTNLILSDIAEHVLEFPRSY
jgi:alkylation response protein AidB-like acyl-CoA dehydrogenase